MTTKLAQNPAATPAKTAAIPAKGDRPTDLYSSAATGGSTTYPASRPAELMTPTNTVAGVSSDRGVTSMHALSAAPISPVFSATPIPSIPTSTTPKGAKLMKLSFSPTTMPYSASRVSIGTALTTSPVSRSTVCPSTWTGATFATSQPDTATRCETTGTSNAPTTNSVTGSGSLLPQDSTRLSRRPANPPPEPPESPELPEPPERTEPESTAEDKTGRGELGIQGLCGMSPELATP